MLRCALAGAQWEGIMRSRNLFTLAYKGALLSLLFGRGIGIELRSTCGVLRGGVWVCGIYRNLTESAQTLTKMPPKQGAQATKWVFTIHDGHLKNPASTLRELLEAYRRIELPFDGMSYLVVQLEKGKEKEREHLQGFVQFDKVVRPTALSKMFNVEEHAFQRANGNAVQNQKYCTKESDRVEGTSPVEIGSPPGGQGTRSDLKRMADKIDQDGLEAAIDEFPHTFVQYSKGCKELSLHYKRKKTKVERKMYVTAIHGTPGSGKSYFAQRFDAGNAWTLPVQTKNSPVWFDGYAGERTLIIEDFDADTIPYRTLLRLLDEGPLQVKISGSYVPAEWNHVVITANDPPQDWYKAGRGDYWKIGEFGTEGPLQRRVHTIVHFEGVFPDVTYLSQGLVLEKPLTLQEIWDLQERPDPIESPPPSHEVSLDSPGIPTFPDIQEWELNEAMPHLPEGGDYDVLEDYPMPERWLDDEADVV